jgi:hypothetical protein
MEDAHISSTDLVAYDDTETNGDNVSVFGVFDGHGGAPPTTTSHIVLLYPHDFLTNSSGKEVAKFCQIYFLRELTQIEDFRHRKFDAALRRCFHRMDEMVEDEANDFQLQQFRKIPNPSDRKPVLDSDQQPQPPQGGLGMDNEDGQLSPPKPSSKKIPITEAMALFQKLLTEQHEVPLPTPPRLTLSTHRQRNLTMSPSPLSLKQGGLFN